jgi:PAS domain S-box-containing protein
MFHVRGSNVNRGSGIQRNLGSAVSGRNPGSRASRETSGTTFAPARDMSVAHVQAQDVLRRYVAAFALTILATAVGLTLTNGLGLRAIGLLTFPMAVLAAAWLGGMGPGILSAIGSAVAVALLFLNPIGSLAIEAPKERIALVAFVMASIIESTVVGTSRRSERSMNRMADAIALSEQKYRVLFERNPEPMWIFDPKTRAILAANDAALAGYGYAEDEIQGMRIDVLFEPGDADRFLADAAGRDQKTWCLVTKRGDRLDVETRCAAAPWLGGLAYVMAARDMTSRVRSERDLRATNEALECARKAAEKATKARDRFLASLSHELRTPLTPALLASAALERRASLPEEIRRSLGLIRAKVKLEALLIEDVLDIARIVNGDFKLEKRPVEVTQIVARAVDACLDEAGAKEIEVRRELAATSCTAWVDPDRLQTAIASAISSAIDTAPAASVVRVWTGDGEAGQITIGVHREGQVVDPVSMFDPFERGVTPAAPAAWSLGLRLAIAKAVVEACGGSLEATSGTEGTDLVMQLPTVWPSPQQG